MSLIGLILEVLVLELMVLILVWLLERLLVVACIRRLLHLGLVCQHLLLRALTGIDHVAWHTASIASHR